MFNLNYISLFKSLPPHFATMLIAMLPIAELRVAVPLPMTGAWTGSLAAFLFGIPAKKAFFSILAGIVIAGIIVIIVAKLGLLGFKTIGA